MRLRTLCLVLFVGLCARPVAAAPILSIEPGTSTVNQGDTFFLDINITDVTDLFGFQFDVLYDPTILTANDDRWRASSFPLAVRRFSFRAIAVSTPGDLSFTIGSASGSESSGREREWHAWRGSVSPQPQAAPVRFLCPICCSRTRLASSSIRRTLNASVDVNASSTAPVPEPGTLMLVGSGLAMAWRKRRHLTGGMA